MQNAIENSKMGKKFLASRNVSRRKTLYVNKTGEKKAK